MHVIKKEILNHILDMIQNPSRICNLRLSYSQQAGDIRDSIRKTGTGFEYCLFSTPLFKWNSSTRKITILLSNYSPTTVSRVKALLTLCFDDVSRRNGAYYIGDLRLYGNLLKADVTGVYGGRTEITGSSGNIAMFAAGSGILAVKTFHTVNI